MRLLISGLIAATAASANAETLESLAVGARTLSVPSLVIQVAKTAQTTSWPDLLRKVGRGEYSRPFGDDNPVSTFGLADIRPHADRASGTPHKADYINLWGMVDENNKFHPSFVTLVSEDWQAFKDQSTKPDVVEGCKQSKCFYVDQWIFTLEMDGSLRRRGDNYSYSHLYIVENTDGRVFDNGAVQPLATDAQGKAKMADLLKKWHAFEAK